MKTFRELREAIKKQTYGLTIFDIDETLFHTHAKILVVDKDGNIKKELSNQEFNTYKLQKGEDYNFSEFKDGQLFRTTSKPNNKILQRIPYIKKNIRERGSKLIFLTARTRPPGNEGRMFEAMVRRTFRDHGVNTSGIDIEMVAGSTYKKPFIQNILSTGKYQRVRLYDDHNDNLNDFLDLQKIFPDIEFTAYKVYPNGSYKIYK